MELTVTFHHSAKAPKKWHHLKIVENKMALEGNTES
jgi:hypothetical protein